MPHTPKILYSLRGGKDQNQGALAFAKHHHSNFGFAKLGYFKSGSYFVWIAKI